MDIGNGNRKWRSGWIYGIIAGFGERLLLTR
jgi:hypothetical protein